MSGVEDTESVRRAQLGDPQAMGWLIDRHRGAVFGLCLHLLGSVDDAQDATQDAFLRACQSIEQLRDPEAFPAWLARIARRECGQYGRRKQADLASIDATPPAEDAPDVPERLDRERLAARLRERLRALPPDTRLIYLLSCLDGLTSQRIGAFLNMKPGTVRARLHRARGKLAKGLDGPGALARDREALTQLEPEVIPVSINYSSACGPFPWAAFPDDIARSLYGYLYSGVPLQQAVRRAGIPDDLAETYLRTWQRYLVIERDGDAIRPLVPISTAADRAAMKVWHQALGRRWAEAVAARNDRIEAIARASAPNGWTATARDAICGFLPFVPLKRELEMRGLSLPPLPRPSGPCHIFGFQHDRGESTGRGKSWALSDSNTGDSEYTMVALIWWDCKHSPEVGKFLDKGYPNPLPGILVGLHREPLDRAGATRQLEEASERYSMPSEDLLDRLIGWRVLSADQPHRVLLPVFVDEVARDVKELAVEIAQEVALEAEQGREALEELIRGCSFADCNRADVYHLLSLFGPLDQLVDAGLIRPLPDACFADRGPFVIEAGLFE